MTAQSIDQITSALNAGRSLDGEQLCRRALLTQPHDESLLFLLAMSLRIQQRLREAVAIHAELVRLFPLSGLHWSNYGAILLKVGAQSDGLNALSKSIQLDPGNPSSRIQWGLWLIERRDYLAARDMLLDAFELDRESPIIRINAARACCLSQDFEGAGSLLKPWRTWLPLNNDGLQLELAQVLTLRNDVPEAAELLEDLLSRLPDKVDARLLLAAIYERFNRLAEAESMASPVVHMVIAATVDERNEATHFLARLASRKNDPDAARQLLEQCGPQEKGDFAHYFQLAGACDKQGDIHATMVALHEAHRLEAIERKFLSPKHFTLKTPALESEAPRIDAAQYQNWPQLNSPKTQDSPVFVVGFPRSGTTLLEQMLDAHPSLQSMDENPFFDNLADTLRNHDARILRDLGVLQQFDCDELRNRYSAMVAERVKRASGTRLIDKNPLNMLWLPFIYRLFPNAKFILALRHPCDVILSCYMQNFRSANLAAACSTLERLAYAYVEVMTRWLKDVSILQPTVMLSHYEELVADLPKQATRIAKFLDLEDATPMLGFDQHARSKTYIGTPSYSQVIEPVNRKGLDRWHRYRREFEPLLPVLEPIMRQWGYWTGEE